MKDSLPEVMCPQGGISLSILEFYKRTFFLLHSFQPQITLDLTSDLSSNIPSSSHTNEILRFLIKCKLLNHYASRSLKCYIWSLFFYSFLPLDLGNISSWHIPVVFNPGPEDPQHCTFCMSLFFDKISTVHGALSY